MWRHLYTLAFFLILGCGKNPPTAKQPVTSKQPQSLSPVSLIVFGAPWCKVCKKDLPKIDELLKSELTKSGSQLKGQLLVTTGSRPSQPPTEQIAKQYRDLLKISFDAGIDEWPWKKFRELVQEEEALPAAVVLYSEGKKKVFLPGQFIAEEVATFVKDQLR